MYDRTHSLDCVREPGAERAADRLRDLALELGHPLQQVAVNWLTAQQGMGPVIAGVAGLSRAPEETERFDPGA